MGSNSPQPCTDCGQRIAMSDSTLCSICETPALPGMSVSGTVGQKDDWFETPWPLAQVCVAQVIAVIEANVHYVHRVSSLGEYNPVRKVLVPSVGRGIFARAVRAYYDELDAPHPYIAGCDTVDRRPVFGLASPPGVNDNAYCDEFAKADARTWVPGPGPWDLAIDNIPFDVELAVPIVQRYVEVASWCAFILPWAGFGGVDVWAPIFGGRWRNDDEPVAVGLRPVYAFPITPRPWGDNVRETALFVWRRDVVPSHTRVRELPRWKP